MYIKMNKGDVIMNKYSIGGGQNTRKINPLFKDIKEYNKYLLSLIGIFVLLLSGIISYNYTNKPEEIQIKFESGTNSSGTINS